jgi:hypothetical protein
MLRVSDIQLASEMIAGNVRVIVARGENADRLFSKHSVSSVRGLEMVGSYPLSTHSVAFVMVLLYDYALTFGEEVSLRGLIRPALSELPSK